MSVCTVIASDHPMPAIEPAQSYPLEIHVDTGTIEDGNADDNFFLYPFPEVQTYTGKPFGVQLEWNYTEGRALRLIEYLRNALLHTERIELWHIWLLGYWEYEDRPVIHRRSIALADLTADDLRILDSSPIWNTPDKQYPDRPSFYCITVT